MNQIVGSGSAHDLFYTNAAVIVSELIMLRYQEVFSQVLFIPIRVPSRTMSRHLCLGIVMSLVLWLGNWPMNLGAREALGN